MGALLSSSPGSGGDDNHTDASTTTHNQYNNLEGNVLSSLLENNNLKNNEPDGGITEYSQDINPEKTTASNFNDLSQQSTMNKSNFSDFNSMINGTINDQNENNSGEFKFNLFGTDYFPLKWFSLTFLYSLAKPLSSAAMVIGCVLPYVPQYLTILKTKNSSGFSTYVCFTLLFSNILRIAFWFGHPFELPLIIQSILQITAQILLLELCIRCKHGYKKSIFSLNPKHFWQWTDLMSYLVFLSLFSILLAISIYFLIDCKPFIESIGYGALLSESMLGLPQVIKNHKNRSVVGMSLSMVLMWLGGDTFKTGYYIANDVPYQFWLCGLIQITIDLLILFQVCLYRQNAPMKKSSQSAGNSSPKEMMAL